jgi:enoyl-CoA hydratase/carnithine racemase
MNMRRQTYYFPESKLDNFLSLCRRAPLITVAALGGPAMGGGAELATSTDFRVMSTKAKIQFVQSRMGVSCGWGGTSRLVKVSEEEKGWRENE